MIMTENDENDKYNNIGRLPARSRFQVLFPFSIAIV